MSREALLIAAAIASIAQPNLARAEEGEVHRRVVTFERLGAGKGQLERLERSDLVLHFATRRDRTPAGATVRLRISRGELARTGASALELRLDGEPLGRVEARDTGRRAVEELTFEADPKIIGLGNELVLHLAFSGEAACRRRVSAGTWSFLESADIELSERTLPVERDLALLPIPFFDPATEDDHTLTFAFDTPPDAHAIRAAALVAGTLGRPQRASGALRFEVVVGALPDHASVVFLLDRGANTDASSATAFGALPITRSRQGSVELLEHPADAAERLLVVSGPDTLALEQAALALATAHSPPSGPTLLASSNIVLPAPRHVNDAPRWVPLGQPTRLAGLEGGDALVAERVDAPRTLAVSFRTPPDLFTWPDRQLSLDLTYAEGPRASSAAEIVVELNGTFLAELPRPADDTGVATARLSVPRGLLHGRDVLHFHVAPRPDDEDGTCDATTNGRSASGRTQVSIAGDSILHLEEAETFAPLPDVGAFASDGHPFSRRADLADTALVLPKKASAGAIAAVLSFVAHAAQVTGLAPVRFAVVDAEAIDAGNGGARDLVVAGAPSELDGLGDWIAAGAIDPRSAAFGSAASGAGASGAQPRSRVLETARRHLAGEETTGAERAATLLASPGGWSAALMFESPFSKGRTVVVLTGDRPAHVAQLADLQAAYDARTERGDLLLATAAHRTLLSIGPEYVSAGAPGTRTTRVRWWLSRNTAALLSALVIGTLLLSRSAERLLVAQTARRLGRGGDA